MSRSTRSVSLLGAAAALVLGLTACGGDDSEYCDLLGDDSELADFDPSDEASMEETSDRIQEVVDAAPDDIKGDWETFASAFEDPEAVADSPDEFTTALENISQHAQDECDIDIDSLS